jgi:DNA-binding NarL/FixJ family response regulator
MMTPSSPPLNDPVTHDGLPVADDPAMAADGDAEATGRRVQLPLRVVLADDHPLILLTLREALGAREDFRVVGEARTGAAAVDLVVETRADLLLVDLRLPDGDGLWAIREVRRRRPRTSVVVLSATERADAVRHAIRLGAVGYLGKSIDAGDVGAVLRQLLQGTILFADRDGGQERAQPSLTDRELQVLTLAAEGLTNVAIARRLFVVEQTVKFHLARAYEKLGAKNRVEAVRIAAMTGLLEEPAGERPA